MPGKYHRTRNKEALGVIASRSKLSPCLLCPGIDMGHDTREFTAGRENPWCIMSSELVLDEAQCPVVTRDKLKSTRSYMKSRSIITPG